MHTDHCHQMPAGPYAQNQVRINLTTAEIIEDALALAKVEGVPLWPQPPSPLQEARAAVLEHHDQLTQQRNATDDPLELARLNILRDRTHRVLDDLDYLLRD